MYAVHRTGLLPQFLVFVDKYEAVMKVLLARSVIQSLCTTVHPRYPAGSLS